MRIDKAEKDNHAVGFFYRHGTIFKDGKNGYGVALHKNGNVSLSSTKAKAVKTVENAVTDVGEFHRLGVSAVGSHFEVTLDGETIITWDDPDKFRSEGFVSLMAGMSNCSFDNVEVVNLSAPSRERGEHHGAEGSHEGRSRERGSSSHERSRHR